MVGIRVVVSVAAALLLFTATAAAVGAGDVEGTLRALAEDASRSPAHRARNPYRHPAETLDFFGIRADMTVVEISPGGGWYTEILAPFLRQRGQLYAAGYDPESESEYYRKGAARFRAKLAADPSRYDRVRVTVFDPPDKLEAAPPGSADMLLTFRNFHNWMGEGSADRALAGFARVLKPGGILGVVQHRAEPSAAQDPKASKGYVREDHLIELAERAGFDLVARSEINANPRDTRDYPDGVWTLPPSFTLGDVDRDRYAAIGESDRMTLKFIKRD